MIKMDGAMIHLTLILLTLQPQLALAGFDPFADAIPFTIKWNGPLDTIPESELDENVITLPMMTKHKEKYQCRFSGQDLDGENSAHLKYDGLSGETILNVFALKTSCSYRVESYWTYELCHGKHLRQYHEEQDPESKDGTIVFPEFYLGNHKGFQSVDKEHMVLLDGVKFPYVAVEYNDGTICDLTNTRRRTTIQYICHESGRGDIIQIKETSTCEYTAIVIMADLCEHPDYRAIRESSRIISCHPLDGAPNKPKMHVEIDTLIQQRKQTVSTSTSTSTGTKTKTVNPIHSVTKEEQESSRTGIGKSEDDLFLQNFLSGEQCLQGSSGWWSFELCYGKTVKQFHLENGKRVTNILLGKWNQDEHFQWLEKYPNKKPRSKPNRRYISQFYSGGDICDATTKPRVVEVKLKCTSATSLTSHAVAIYLLEPAMCEYLLTVESPVLCSLVDRADGKALLTN